MAVAVYILEHEANPQYEYGQDTKTELEYWHDASLVAFQSLRGESSQIVIAYVPQHCSVFRTAAAPTGEEEMCTRYNQRLQIMGLVGCSIPLLNCESFGHWEDDFSFAYISE